jgi:hypothetical protein
MAGRVYGTSMSQKGVKNGNPKKLIPGYGKRQQKESSEGPHPLLDG